MAQIYEREFAAQPRRTSRAGRGPVDRATAATLVLTLAGAGLLVLLLALQPRFPFADLSRDPLAVVGQTAAPHLGFLSNLGILLWCVGAVVSAFMATRLAAAGGDPRFRRFLFTAAVFSAVLLVDDLFMLHENLKARVAHGDLLLFAVHGTFALAYCLALARVARALGVLPLCLLFLAGGFLAVSITADLGGPAADLHATWPWVLEDGSKFVGIAFWAAFHLRAAWILGFAPPQGEPGMASRQDFR